MALSGAGRLGHWLGALGEAAGRLAFPLECQVCGDDGLRAPLCDDCRAEVLGAGGAACPRCAMPVGSWERSEAGCSWCRRRRLGFDAAWALAPYQGPMRHLCLRLKSQRSAWLAPWLVDVLLEARGEALRAEGPAAVVAVPLHWWRRLGRGYDQAEALGRALAGRLGVAFARPLRRVVRTPKLAGLGRVERARRLRNAFHARPLSVFAGRTVLLVDDILTTGATCGAAARALKAAGARRVVAVVIGRAEGRD